MLRGKVFVVSGATSGIGRAAARTLAISGAQVELLGRDTRRGTALVRELSAKAGVARFHRVDLSERDEVKRVTEAIARSHPAIDGLINNAGARNHQFVQNSDGLETTFAANHLGHFALTCLLLDRLLAAPQGRIVTVTSESHRVVQSVETWLLTQRNYDRRIAYAQSKLANVLFAYGLAERMRGTQVTSNAFDPGGVASRFAGNNGRTAWMRHVASHALRRDIVTASTAAKSLVALATSPVFAGTTAGYFLRDVPKSSSAVSHDACAATQLWEMSIELCGLDAANCRAWAMVRP